MFRLAAMLPRWRRLALLGTLGCCCWAQAATYPYVNVYFQTSGRERAAGIGDWYTTKTSSSTNRFHRFDITITQDELDAAGGSITLTVNDAESYGNLDEVGGTLNGTTNPDPTRFTLRSAGATSPSSGGNLIQQQVFSTAVNGQTFTYSFTTPGTYILFSEDGAYPIYGTTTANLNDDDNSFSITIGTNDFSPIIADPQVAMQATTTTTFEAYFYVAPGTTGPLQLRNFDLDSGGTVSYLRPDGSAVSGTASNDGVWNGSAGALNTGSDSVLLAPTGGTAQYGWWRIRIADWTSNNQTIFEAKDGNGNTLPLIYGVVPAWQLTKTVSTATAVVGETITYTVTLKNTGTTGATGINISDSLPSGLSYLSSTVTVPSGSAGTYNSDTGLWHIRNLGAGATATLEIRATVTATGAATNTASLTSTDQPFTPIAPATASTTAYPSTLTVSKAVDRAYVKYAGSPASPNFSQLTYTIVVSSAGQVAANNVVVTDTLPLFLTNPVVKEGAATITPTITALADGRQQLVWNAGTVNSTTSHTYTVTVDLPAASILEANQTSSAWVNDVKVSSSNHAEKSASATTDSIYTTLLKKVRNRGPQGTLNSAFSTTTGSGYPGDVLEYCIDARNWGSKALGNYVMTDSIPGNTSYVSGTATLTGGTGTPTFDNSVTAWDNDNDPNTPAIPVSGKLSVMVGTLTAGATAKLCFQAKIK